ncbi:MAG TPA: hypothetical protein VH170_07815 [Chthoniobacterales bacterium]|jgi:opacity protein-like surface antigen|nr:hypothetical protein [Chthoniobacterales bacterium]
MKPSRYLPFAVAACAAISLAPSGAPAAENVLVALMQTPSDPCNWGGFYIGFNVGGSFNHFEVDKQRTDVDLEQQFYKLLEGNSEGGDGITGEGSAFTTFHVPGHSVTDTQTTGGGQTGFNFQFGHFVAGLEGSFQGNGSSANSRHNEFQENNVLLITQERFAFAETKFVNERMVETTWNGSAGGKFGFCWNRILFFVAGGAAFTDLHFSSMDKADTSFFGFVGDGLGASHPAVQRVTGGPRQGEGFIGEIVSKHTHTSGDVLTGYYVGGGSMYQLTNLVSAGFEYRHVNWGEINEGLTGGNGPVFSGNGHVDLTADQIMFKVNILVGSLFH